MSNRTCDTPHYSMFQDRGTRRLLYAVFLLLFGLGAMPTIQLLVTRYRVASEADVPLVVTKAVSLRHSVIVRLQEHGVKDFKNIPSKSGAESVFHYAVNGKVDRENFSGADYAEKLYRVSLADFGVQVYVRPDAKGKFTPQELQALIEYDVTTYFDRKERLAKREALLTNWDK
jgi:hypothetical protein